MQEELEKMVQLESGKLSFTDNQIDFMLQNIGNLDPYLRDDVVYTLLPEVLLRIHLHLSKKIVTTFISSKIYLKVLSNHKMT
ncbi:hypothetical protein SDC49_00645 [Lactobacillus sp. R2/2]|nr:hypothetical protein [Lactobacillus sp. R2/2]